MASAEAAAGTDAALPYAYFEPLQRLLAAEGDATQMASLLDLPRGDTSVMADVKRACAGERSRLLARLNTLTADMGGTGAVLRCRASPHLLVMPRELLRLAVIMAALTVYSKLPERRGAVSAVDVSESMSEWMWMPEGKGNVAWGAVAASSVATILASFKADGSHSIVGGLKNAIFDDKKTA